MVTIVWVVQYNLGLRSLLVLHIHISPSTSSGQRNCVSWASQPQKSITLRPQPGGETTKSIRDNRVLWMGVLCLVMCCTCAPHHTLLNTCALFKIDALVFRLWHNVWGHVK